MQKFTSATTSINCRKLPAVYNKAKFSAPCVLDYGCGKYTDHIKDFLRHNYGVVLLRYDPYNQPKDINNDTKNCVRSFIRCKCPLDVVCSNVLNVIDSDDAVQKIARYIENVVTKTGGTAYITVYEGDRSGIGRQTGKDSYQRNARLRDYLRFFRNARVYKGMIIVER